MHERSREDLVNVIIPRRVYAYNYVSRVFFARAAMTCDRVILRRRFITPVREEDMLLTLSHVAGQSRCMTLSLGRMLWAAN